MWLLMAQNIVISKWDLNFIFNPPPKKIRIPHHHTTKKDKSSVISASGNILLTSLISHFLPTGFQIY